MKQRLTPDVKIDTLIEAHKDHVICGGRDGVILLLNADSMSLLYKSQLANKGTIFSIIKTGTIDEYALGTKGGIVFGTHSTLNFTEESVGMFGKDVNAISMIDDNMYLVGVWQD